MGVSLATLGVGPPNTLQKMSSTPAMVALAMLQIDNLFFLK